MHFILNLILGGLAGFLAGKIMESKGGMLRNIILGLIGGVVGMGVDAATGSTLEHYPNPVLASLVPLKKAGALGRGKHKATIRSKPVQRTGADEAPQS